MSSKPTSKQDSLDIPTTSAMTSITHGAMADVLREMGISPEAVNLPSVAHHEKIAWEDLCVLPTRDPQTMVSDLCVVVAMSANIDAEQEYTGYKGLLRLEFVTPLGDKLFVSTSMTYADTGELTPMWSWVNRQTLPFAVRFGRIETRKRNQYVIRPMPLDIETV